MNKEVLIEPKHKKGSREEVEAGLGNSGGMQRHCQGAQ